jgi:hypothetical protein
MDDDNDDFYNYVTGLIPITESETYLNKSITSDQSSFMEQSLKFNDLNPQRKFIKLENFDKAVNEQNCCILSVPIDSDDHDSEIVLYMNYEIFSNDKNKEQISNFYCRICVFISVDKIILANYKSYSRGNYEENILHQFEVDFPRMDILFNSMQCDAPHLLKYIDRLKIYSHEITGNAFNLLIMLCTQSPFFDPYAMIHRIYTESDNQIHIVSGPGTPTINIIDNDTSIDIIYKKTFKSINSITKETVCLYDTTMRLTIDLIIVRAGYIFSGYAYCKSGLGLIHWIKKFE